MCVYVCMYVCMYIGMYQCMYVYVLVYLSCLSPFYFTVYTTRDIRPLEEMLFSVGSGGLRYLKDPGPL
jgi:hypothetical protein